MHFHPYSPISLSKYPSTNHLIDFYPSSSPGYSFYQPVNNLPSALIYISRSKTNSSYLRSSYLESKFNQRWCSLMHLTFPLPHQSYLWIFCNRLAAILSHSLDWLIFGKLQTTSGSSPTLPDPSKFWQYVSVNQSALCLLPHLPQSSQAVDNPASSLNHLNLNQLVISLPPSLAHLSSTLTYSLNCDSCYITTSSKFSASLNDM